MQRSICRSGVTFAILGQGKMCLRKRKPQTAYTAAKGVEDIRGIQEPYGSTGLYAVPYPASIICGTFYPQASINVPQMMPLQKPCG